MVPAKRPFVVIFAHINGAPATLLAGVSKLKVPGNAGAKNWQAIAVRHTRMQVFLPARYAGIKPIYN